MTPTEHRKTVRKTARYYTLGTLGPQTKTIWLCCHGYGQIAQRFAQSLAPLADAENFVLAPEGLNRFYWHNARRTPVATWMTRAARLDEIADYAQYLDDLLSEQLALITQPVRVVAFGFSQGSQTIIRYLNATRRAEVSHVITYAGAIPDDLDYTTIRDYFNARPLLIPVGDTDQYLTEENLDRYRMFLNNAGLKYSEIPFAGGHEIVEEVLLRLKEQLL